MICTGHGPMLTKALLQNLSGDRLAIESSAGYSDLF